MEIQNFELCRTGQIARQPGTGRPLKAAICRPQLSERNFSIDRDMGLHLRGKFIRNGDG